MARSVPQFVDLHPLLIGYLAEATSARVSSLVPEDLSSPAVVVLDVTGSDDSVTDSVTFDVQTFAPTRKASWELAEKVRTAVFRLAGERGVDSTQTLTRPTRVSYGNPSVTRYVATYRVTARGVEAP